VGGEEELVSAAAAAAVGVAGYVGLEPRRAAAVASAERVLDL
jgi:hypothetical protein